MCTVSGLVLLEQVLFRFGRDVASSFRCCIMCMIRLLHRYYRRVHRRCRLDVTRYARVSTRKSYIFQILRDGFQFTNKIDRILSAIERRFQFTKEISFTQSCL